MERIVQTHQVDGHVVSVVEHQDDDVQSFLVLVDEVVLNEDAPLGQIPTTSQIHDMVRRWTASSGRAPGSSGHDRNDGVERD
jgi:hypothetical protein